MLTNLFLPKWCDVPLLLFGYEEEKVYYQNILRRTRIAGSHVRTTLKLLTEKGFIDIRNDEKIKYIRLTDRGVRLMSAIREIKELLDQNEGISQDNDRLCEV